MNRDTTIESVIAMDGRAQEATSQFYNSAPVGTICDPQLGPILGETELHAANVVLVAVLSGCHILLVGGTARGKTALVSMLCQGIFGRNGWHLARLNPNLTEDTFGNIDMKKLAEGTMRDAVEPAEFLSLPAIVLDELNRAPAPLTNILLGVCDKKIELKCGVKHDVGYTYATGDGLQSYLFVCGTVNEGAEYAGTFEVDHAVRRRFTLELSLDDLPPTPDDMLQIIENRSGHATLPDLPGVADEVAAACDRIVELPLDPLATVYSLYLGNVGRCPHSATGFHPHDPAQELCRKAECRIHKAADGFCPSAGGFNEGLLVFLKRSACGVAALRMARTVKGIRAAVAAGDEESISQLQRFAATGAKGEDLFEQVVARYLDTAAVTVGDVKTVAPLVGAGGKVWLAEEYVAKHFAGSRWAAMQHYVRHTYGGYVDLCVMWTRTGIH